MMHPNFSRRRLGRARFDRIQGHHAQSITGQISVFLTDGMILGWRDPTGEKHVRYGSASRLPLRLVPAYQPPQDHGDYCEDGEHCDHFEHHCRTLSVRTTPPAHPTRCTKFLELRSRRSTIAPWRFVNVSVR
jgi:hypothetical protein